MEATRSYSGSSDELKLFLAPPSSGCRPGGMDGEVEAGEKLEVVGYLDREHDDELRPEMIVLEDGQAVRQRSVPLPVAPEAAPQGGDAAAPAESASGTGAGGATDDDGTSSSAASDSRTPPTRPSGW
ncbi:hypothetical protein GCM10020295_03050 [Streptomyces cinereospinus]